MHRHCICTVLLPWHPDLACFGLSTRGQWDSRTTEVKSVFCCQHNHMWNPEIPKVWSEADWKEELEGFPATVRVSAVNEWKYLKRTSWASVSVAPMLFSRRLRDWTGMNSLSLSFLFPSSPPVLREKLKWSCPTKTQLHTTLYTQKNYVCHKYSMLFCGHRFW